MSGPDTTRRAALLAAPLALTACASVTPVPVQMALCPPPQPRGDLLGEGTTERRVLVPSTWGFTHAWVRGGTDARKTPLLLLHMMPFSGAYWRPFMAELAKDRLVIAPDMPGCGLSDGPANDPTMTDYADALLEFINLTRLGEVDVLGFHTGSFLAAELSHHAERTVRRAVLTGIPYFDEPTRTERLARTSPIPLGTPQEIATRWSVLDQFLVNYGPDRKRELISESIHAGPNIHRPTRAVLTYACRERLSTMRNRTLVLVLDEMLAAETRAASGLIRGADVRERMQWKSDAWETKSAELAAEIDDFLS
jgi:pimeloyl-ACP methyl ester carboxylesterase